MRIKKLEPGTLRFIFHLNEHTSCVIHVKSWASMASSDLSAFCEGAYQESGLGRLKTTMQPPGGGCEGSEKLWVTTNQHLGKMGLVGLPRNGPGL